MRLEAHPPTTNAVCMMTVVRGDATRKTTNAVWIVTGKAGTLNISLTSCVSAGENEDIRNAAAEQHVQVFSVTGQ